MNTKLYLGYPSQNIINWLSKKSQNLDIPLTFTSTGDHVCVILNTVGTPDPINIEYSKDNGKTWIKFIPNNFALEEQLDFIGIKLYKNQSLMIKATDEGNNTFSKDKNNYYTFQVYNYGGQALASGNIQTLLDNSGNREDVPDYCFYKLFTYDAELLQAPDLPGKKLGKYCYSYMFENCTSLIETPKLQSTELAEGCYMGMFQSCESLLTSTELPAMTLAKKCYREMFNYCKRLTHAHELSATELDVECYAGMFGACESLTQAPSILPAVTLADGCYTSMFSYCLSLTHAPELPATTLARDCYYYMFQDCKKLTYINVNFSSWELQTPYISYPTYDWVYNITTQGVFVCPNDLKTEYSSSRIPNNWQVFNKSETENIKTKIVIPTGIKQSFEYTGKKHTCVIPNAGYTLIGTSSAIEVGTYTVTAKLNEGYIWSDDTLDDKEITWSITSAVNSWIIEPSLNKVSWTEGNNDIILNTGTAKFGEVSIKLNGNNYTSLPETPGKYTLEFTVSGTNNYSSINKIINFEILEKTNVNNTPLTFTSTGDSTVLLNKYNKPDDISLTYQIDDNEPQNYTIGTQIDLTDGQSLKMYATTENATISKDTKNYYKFIIIGNIAASGNINTLLKADGSVLDLTADDIDRTYCYNNMFYGCTALKQAPELPATTLTEGCYYNMFNNCSSLTQAPELPAKVLAKGCYNSMFAYCKRLAQASELPATELAENCYLNMFSNCNSLTQAPTLSAKTLAKGCYNSMFAYCEKLIQAPELPATELAENCYLNMFENCSSLTQAPSILPAKILAKDCYNYMFYNCTSLLAAPIILATTLTNQCYCMFQSCQSPFTFPDKTFDEVANLIQDQYLIGDYWWYNKNDEIINPIEIICSDKTMLASYDEDEWTWTLTEK